MLRIELTDGLNKASAIEIQHHPAISYDTLCPGMKILFPAKTEVRGGFILLDRNAKFLGGLVPHLAQQFEDQRKLARHKRTGGGDDQPPPFEPFSKV